MLVVAWVLPKWHWSEHGNPRRQHSGLMERTSRASTKPPQLSSAPQFFQPRPRGHPARVRMRKIRVFNRSVTRLVNSRVESRDLKVGRRGDLPGMLNTAILSSGFRFRAVDLSINRDTRRNIGAAITAELLACSIGRRTYLGRWYNCGGSYYYEEST